MQKIKHTFIGVCYTGKGQSGNGVQLLLNAMLKYVPRKYRLSVRPAESATFVLTSVKPLLLVACKFFRVPDFTSRGQKLKSLLPLRHVYQLFQRYREFLGIRRWQSSDLDTLPIRDSVMNSQTVAASFVIPHVSKSVESQRLASVVLLANFVSADNLRLSRIILQYSLELR